MSTNEKMDVLLSKVEFIGQKMDSLDRKMDSVEQRVGSMEQKMDSVEQRVGSIEQKVAAVEMNLETMSSDVKDVKLIIENEVRLNIQRVAEGHLDLSRNLQDAMRPSNEVEMLAIRVRMLETDVRDIKNKIS